MFFIYGTDAPLYHYPIVTAAMVVVNVAVHVLLVVTGTDPTPCILAFGDGYHPVQWLTHNFLHAGWVHLIGNMLFLVPFGMVVEGKIGWARMLVLYLAIGIVQGFVQQTIMLPSDPAGDADALVAMFDNPDSPLDEETKATLKAQWRQDLMKEGFGSLGASAVIFGLLAVCVLWAPTNNFDVYFRWSLFVSASDGGLREWPVSTVCAIFVVKEAFMFWMSGMPISSEALHLNGFVVGGGCGLAMLVWGWVDCEGYDLLSVWGGTPFKAAAIKKREARDRAERLELLKPAGPPIAIVPKMPHQIAPTVPHQPTPIAAATPFDGHALIGSAAVPFDADLSLPAFDDGSRKRDPTIAMVGQIESAVSRGDHVAALRQFASVRKSHPTLVIAPGAIGKLAEGLVVETEVASAIKVLLVGCQAYPGHAPQWQIRIASLHLIKNQDADAALKQLHRINVHSLNSHQRDQYERLIARANAMSQ